MYLLHQVIANILTFFRTILNNLFCLDPEFFNRALFFKAERRRNVHVLNSEQKSARSCRIDKRQMGDPAES